jgi:Zn-dependent protease
VVLAVRHTISSFDIVIFCTIIPSIILHEISHGWVALAFGDDTAKRAGRLTLNPIPHIDPVGSLLVPGLMALSGLGFFGWAKPVPVNLSRLRSPRNQGVLVSLAGPFTNLVITAIAAVVFLATNQEHTGLTLAGPFRLTIFAEVLFVLGLVNIGLAAFNLIPIPPLDGSVLLERLLPRSWWPGYLRLRPYTMPVLMGIVIFLYLFGQNQLDTLYAHVINWWYGVLRVPVRVIG